MISTILLTQENVYVKEDGTLPSRPSHDKSILSNMLKGHTVTKKGFAMLPNSMKKDVFCDERSPSFPVTVPEIEALSDIILVVRSIELCRGKVFRLDSFELLLKNRDIELWIRK